MEKNIISLIKGEGDWRRTNFIYLFIYLFIIVTWKGNLEEKTKLFWGHFLTKKLENVFGKVYFSQV
jgi:hypothetical protein